MNSEIIGLENGNITLKIKKGTSKNVKVTPDMRIIFNEGYICIDEMFMLEKEYLTLDNIVLQKKIEDNEPFELIGGRLNTIDVHKLKELIPENMDDYKVLHDTDLISSYKKDKYEVYANSKGIFLFNTIHLKYLPKDVIIYGKDKFGSCPIIKDEKIMGLIISYLNHSYILGLLNDAIIEKGAKRDHDQ